MSGEDEEDEEQGGPGDDKDRIDVPMHQPQPAIDGGLALVPGDLARILRPNALRVYVDLQARGGLTKYVPASPSAIGRSLNLHRNSVSRALKQLADLHLIVRGQTGRQSWYRALLPGRGNGK